MTWKPGQDHPWNVRTRAQVVAQEKKKKRTKDKNDVGAIDALREYESSEQSSELDNYFKEFFL